MQKKRVLVIEDSHFICALLEKGFREHGFEVSTSYDGKEGLLRAQAEQPELIILDLVLPEMPGEEVCRRLKKDTRTEKIPIIMLTGKTSDTDRILGRVIGADAYIPKPFEMERLMREVKKFIMIAFLCTVCLFSGGVFAEQYEKKPDIPVGMELIKVGGTNVLVPAGTKITKKDALLILEPPEEYMARKMLVLEEEIARLKKEQEKLVAQILRIKESVLLLQKHAAQPRAERQAVQRGAD